MSLFVAGLGRACSKDVRAAMLICDMYIFLVVVYAKHVEEEKLKDKEEYRNKKAKTRNESGQQKDGLNRP